jgi:hypothetical protein
LPPGFGGEHVEKVHWDLDAANPIVGQVLSLTHFEVTSLKIIQPGNTTADSPLEIGKTFPQSFPHLKIFGY